MNLTNEHKSSLAASTAHFDEADRLVSLNETAAYCGVCRQSIANWARKGEFPAPMLVGTGRLIRWKMSEVREWINNRPRKAIRSNKPSAMSLGAAA